MKNGMERINELIEQYDFPGDAIDDVRLQLGKHLMQGGKPNDGFVQKQLRRLESLIQYGLVERKAVTL